MTLPTKVAKINFKPLPTFSAVFSNATKRSIMMKNLKLVLPLFAIILGLGLVFTQSAFQVSNKSTTLRYRYIGNDEAGLKTLSNWQEIAPEDTPAE